MGNNDVVFKGKRNNIIILLNNNVPFEELKQTFFLKLYSAKNFFKSSKTSISFEGRDLSSKEEQELINIILNESDLNISFINNQYLLKSNNPQSKVKEQFHFSENQTKFHIGSLRSGQSIRFAGSVVIIGDINPGAEVIAEGNIIINGTLKGLVHAGCTGNKDCFVTAFNLVPTQLRIADIITYIPKSDMPTKYKNKNNFDPCRAYINQGQIYIETLIC